MAAKRDKQNPEKGGIRDIADSPAFKELAELIESGKIDQGRLDNYLQSLKEERRQALPDVLTIQQVATLLQVSRQTIYKLLEKKKLKGKRIGKRWRFSKAAIIRSLEGGRQ